MFPLCCYKVIFTRLMHSLLSKYENLVLLSEKIHIVIQFLILTTIAKPSTKFAKFLQDEENLIDEEKLQRNVFLKYRVYYKLTYIQN